MWLFLFHPHRFQIYTLVIAFLRAGGQRPSRPELQKTWLLLGLLLLVVPVDAAITCVKAGSTPGISQGKAAGFVTLRHLGCFLSNELTSQTSQSISPDQALDRICRYLLLYMRATCQVLGIGMGL